jgi:hypothetical protein
MVVYDLNVPCRTFAPFKAYPPLFIDADAVLAAPIAAQGFKPISRRDAQIIELFGRVDRKKLGPCPALNLIGQVPDDVAGT